MLDLLTFIRTHFFHVLPILIAGAFAGAIVLERGRTLLKRYPMENVEAFFERVTELVLKNKLSEAVALCDRYEEKPAAQVTKQALLRAHQPENLIESGISLSMGKLTETIQKRTSFLATIANVATLLGLFGTIAGLIHSFSAAGAADPAQKSALLAAGISEAMNATILGLALAIPCMVAFSFLISRTNKLMSEVDGAALRVLDLLKQRIYAVECDTLGSLEKQG